MNHRPFSRAGLLLLALVLTPACVGEHGGGPTPPVALAIFTGNEGNGDILSFDESGSGALLIDTGAGNLLTHLGLAYEATTGNLFYSSKDGDRNIYRVSAAGVETPFASTRPGGGPLLATDLAFSPVSGLLHAVSMGATNKIIVFDAAGTGTEVHDTGNSNATFGLAINALGEIFYSDFTTHEVRQVTGATSFFVVAGAADGLNQSRGLAFDGQGRLLVASFGTNAVHRFTPFGPRVVLFDAADGLASPADIAWDSVSGHIFVTQVGGSPAIVRFDSDGNPVGVQPLADGADGLSNPRSIALNR